MNLYAAGSLLACFSILRSVGAASLADGEDGPDREASSWQGHGDEYDDGAGVTIDPQSARQRGDSASSAVKTSTPVVGKFDPPSLGGVASGTSLQLEKGQPPQYLLQHPSFGPEVRLLHEAIRNAVDSSSSSAADAESGHEEPRKCDAGHVGERTLSSKVGDDDDFDERTLLDIFGEVAKEFLTQKVIPATDAECRWDWRSVRCEPACQCELRPAWGDYHLGRSCRLWLQRGDVGKCVDVDPMAVYEDRPIPRRLLSLLHTTVDVVREKTLKGAGGLSVRAGTWLSRVQKNVCSDLWDLKRRHANDCWPGNRRPEVSLPERVFCGPIDFPVCATVVGRGGDGNGTFME